MTYRALLAVAAALTLAAPVVAPAAIRPGSGIGDVRLGQTQESVRDALGEPDAIRRAGEPGVDASQITLWTYRDERLVVGFQAHGPRVTSVETTSGRERTAEGVGVGSTERRVRAEMRGERCDDVGGGRRACTLGRIGVGRPMTTFLLTRGVVRRVSVTLQGP